MEQIILFKCHNPLQIVRDGAGKTLVSSARIVEREERRDLDLIGLPYLAEYRPKV